MLSLELAIEDALFRIKREYKRTGGKIYLSFSGGKDSTVLAKLIEMADLPEKIPFVFANTGIELDATLRHVKEYPYENVQIIKTRKPAPRVWKDYGKPIVSKLKSEALSTYQNNIDNPLGTSRTRQMITGEAERSGVKLGKTTMYILAQKHFHLLHHDLEYSIANKCCQYMKKYPFQDYAKENGMEGSFSGVRTAEGGVRSIAYKSCVQVKKLNGKDFLMSMPIIDWSDELVEEFIETYKIKLSDAYTVYGADRTGCIACPFSQNLQKDLKILWDHEPHKYKASMKMLGDVYMDSGIECPWDEEYTEKFNERQKLNEERRKEMLDKFSDEVSGRSKIGKVKASDC
ncbi:phosphoadenosine phosphosulfate reductase domain-containing protein [Bacillus cereus]